MKTSKVLSITTLAIIALLLTAFTWAYWADGVMGNNTANQNTISLGKAVSASTDVTVTPDKTNANNASLNLVPAGRASQSVTTNGTPTEKMVFTYTVKWSSALKNTATGTTGKLTVTPSSQAANAAAIAHLVNFDIQISNGGAIIADGDSVTVTATVTLTEPKDKAEYDLVKENIISSDFLFVVTSNN